MESIECIEASCLSTADLAAWGSLQERYGLVRSPFFRPEFSRAAASVGARVEVAVVRRDGVAVAFWPFERLSNRRAGPVGGIMSDFQGVIADPEVEIEPRAILRRCGLRGYEFDHLLGAQKCFAPFHGCMFQSPYLDVGGGVEGYLARRGARSEDFRKAVQKARKARLECNSLALHYNDPSPESFRQIVRWKSEQFEQTGATNVFAKPHTIDLMQAMARETRPEFSGLVCALRIDGELAAAHMCLRSGPVLHVWVSSYNREFARRSPGILLLLELIESADTFGINLIDLGKGDEVYKNHFMTGAWQIAEGSVEISGLTTRARQATLRAKRRLMESPFRPAATAAARAAARVFPPARRWLKMRPRWRADAQSVELALDQALGRPRDANGPA